jgi:hypothetical protein
MQRLWSIVAACSLVVCAAAMAQDKQPENEALPGAIPLNLQLEATPPEEAFAELSKQAGVKFTPNMQDIWAKSDPVDAKVENGYFWPVFIDMCQQANIRFNPQFYSGDARSLQIFSSEQGIDSFTQYPWVNARGCVILAMNANRNYSVQYGAHRDVNTNFGIQAILLIDPGVQISGNPQAEVAEAVDENGTSLVPQQNGGIYYGSNGPSLYRNVHINLRYPPNAGKKLVRLKGAIKATVASKLETLVADLAGEFKPQTKELTSATAQIKSVKVTDTSAEVQATVHVKRQLQGMEYQSMWDLLQNIQVTDEKGNPCLLNSRNLNQTDPNTFTATMKYSVQNAGGKPAKATWVLPVETQEVRLPFEFKDLVIP